MSGENPSSVPLTIGISGAGFEDSDKLDQHTRQLRRELIELGFEARTARSSAPPQGTKSAEAFTLGALTLAVLPTTLPKLLDYLQSWTMRGENRTIKVKAQVGDRSIELEYSPKAMPQDEMLRFAERLSQALAGSEAK